MKRAVRIRGRGGTPTLIVSKTGLSSSIATFSTASSALTTVSCGIVNGNVGDEVLAILLSSSSTLPVAFFLRPRVEPVVLGALGALGSFGFAGGGAVDFLGETERRDRRGASGASFGVVGSFLALVSFGASVPNFGVVGSFLDLLSFDSLDSLAVLTFVGSFVSFVSLGTIVSTSEGLLGLASIIALTYSSKSYSFAIFRAVSLVTQTPLTFVSCTTEYCFSMYVFSASFSFSVANGKAASNLSLALANTPHKQ